MSGRKDLTAFESCFTCRFWRDSGDGQCGTDGGVNEFGWCRRYPPKRTQDDSFGYSFARVEASEWCGEYQPTPEVPK